MTKIEELKKILKRLEYNPRIEKDVYLSVKAIYNLLFEEKEV